MQAFLKCCIYRQGWHDILTTNWVNFPRGVNPNFEKVIRRKILIRTSIGKLVKFPENPCGSFFRSSSLAYRLQVGQDHSSKLLRVKEFYYQNTSDLLFYGHSWYFQRFSVFIFTGNSSFHIYNVPKTSQGLPYKTISNDLFIHLHVDQLNSLLIRPTQLS